MIVKISKKQRELLEAILIENKVLSKIIDSVTEKKQNFYMDLAEEELDLIRDLCFDKLDYCGYDKNYELTIEGTILEELIDLFYVKKE